VPLSEENELTNWYQAIAEDPEYYTNTEQGQKELAEMIRRESERLIEEIGKSVKRTKEIIFLSRFCSDCKHFRSEGRKMECGRWSVRIVKPFYGSPMWTKVPSSRGEGKELAVEGIDWDEKWKEISDKVVEQAIGMVNGGYPYYCFTGK
ncbi:MAG TPA: hypothetical protein VEJ36_01575, partial [Nitrososphaerales archaeon]|nr:hypothetical protein [Nitrososphaerales archaeon]